MIFDWSGFYLVSENPGALSRALPTHSSIFLYARPVCGHPLRTRCQLQSGFVGVELGRPEAVSDDEEIRPSNAIFVGDNLFCWLRYTAHEEVSGAPGGRPGIERLVYK